MRNIPHPLDSSYTQVPSIVGINDVLQNAGGMVHSNLSRDTSHKVLWYNLRAPKCSTGICENAVTRKAALA